MATNDLGQFANKFAEWRRVIATMPDIDTKARCFTSAANEVAGYVANGLTKAVASDELREIANSSGLLDACGEDHIQLTISDAFAQAQYVPEWENETKQSEQRRAPKSNGHAPSLPVRATQYIAPDAAAIPRRQWLYGMHYMRGVVTATVAPGGFGKTTLSLHEAIKMAVAGHRVWYVSAEDDRDEIDRRIAAHFLKHGIKPLDLSQRLFVDDKTTFPFKVGSQGRSGIVFDEAALAAFESCIKTDKIDVVILDPFISFHYLNENDTAAMDALVKRLGEIAQRNACCIELSHHVRKPSMGQVEITVYDARGAGAIVNAVRSCRVLNQMTLPAAAAARISPDDRFRYIRIDSGKRNMAPPEGARWGRLINVELPNGDHVQALEEWSYPIDVTTDDDKTWLRVVLAEKPLRVSSQSPDWLGIKVAKRLGLSVEKTEDIKTINRKLARWHSEGLIKKDETILDEKRKPRPHWVLGDKAQPEVTNNERARNEVDEELELPL